MFQRRAYSMCVSAALLLAVVRCRTDHIPTAPGIVAVSLTPPAATLRLGTIVQLTPTVTVDGRTAARPVRFESSDPSVVSIADDGTLRAMRLGTATVTATSENSSASALITVIAGRPASIVKVVGDSQVTAAGTAVAIPPVVILRDSVDNPVAGVIVTFSGTGAVTGASATTDARGEAAVTSWTLASEGGPNVLTATAAGVGYVSFNAKGTAPTIAVGSNGFAASRLAGSLAPITQVVPITNAGSGTLSGLAVGAITFAGAPGWLTASIEGTTAPTNLHLSANPAGLPVGTYSATVPVVGANAMNRVEELVFTLTIDPVPTSTTLLSTVNPSLPGEEVALTATVTASGIVATGTVQFRDGDVPLGAPVALAADGTATLMTSALSLAGSPHGLSAAYSGDAKTLPSVSATVSQVVAVAVTSVRLTSNADQVTTGTPVTFTATVTGSRGTPTGTVEFRDGSTILGSASLAGGVATFSTLLSPVPHTITATYAGDAGHSGSTSVPLAQLVSRATSSVSLSSSSNPAGAGSAITFTATVAGALGTPTGTITFKDGTSALATIALVGGSARFTTSSLAAAGSPHTIVSEYSGDANNLPSTSEPLSQSVTRLATSITVSSSAAIATFAQPVTFTATVAASGVPTGTVQFMDGAVALGPPRALSESGQATFTTASLAAGSDAHAVTAVYSGDAAHLPSTSASFSQVVQFASTTATLNASALSSIAGEPVAFTVVVRSADGVPGGTVQIKDGSVVLGTAGIGVDGVANFSTATLAPGTHTITAAYLGAGGYLPSSASLTYSVGKATPSNVLSATAIWQTTTLVARIDGALGMPTGTVTFKDGTITISGAIPVINGVATLSTLIPPYAGAPHSIVAQYSGDANYVSAASAPLNYSITEATLTLERTVGTSPAALGSALTFTATATAVDPGRPAPTGQVQFRVDGVNVGALVPLVGGSASFTTSSLGVSATPHVISANYTGDINFKQAVSREVTQTITP